MSGIYIHVPFCKKACIYCDFHFSTSLKNKEEMVSAMVREVRLTKNYLRRKPIETIYFGGGTPSVLTVGEIQKLIDVVYKNHRVADKPEITLEANPDDLSRQKIVELSKTPINRLSIGVQSFLDKDLKFMNRSHDAFQSKKCLPEALRYFNNISIDLIYGIPNSTNENWLRNINTALSFDIKHLSCYAMTVEPRTVLDSFIKKGIVKNISEKIAEEQYYILIRELKKANFIHYEISNFGKKAYLSKHNSAYWLRKNYIGIGPSAHSFNGIERNWNINNNRLYIKSLFKNELPKKSETLSLTDSYNEYIMTGLRTIWGVSLEKVRIDYGDKYLKYLLKSSEKYIENSLLLLEKGVLKTSERSKFISDGITTELFSD